MSSMHCCISSHKEIFLLLIYHLFILPCVLSIKLIFVVVEPLVSALHIYCIFTSRVFFFSPRVTVYSITPSHTYMPSSQKHCPQGVNCHEVKIMDI